MHKLTKILTAVTVSATLLAGTVPFISNAAPVMVQDTDTVETRFESSVPAVEEKPSARTDNLKGAVKLKQSRTKLCLQRQGWRYNMDY